MFLNLDCHLQGYIFLSFKVNNYLKFIITGCTCFEHLRCFSCTATENNLEMLFCNIKIYIPEDGTVVVETCVNSETKCIVIDGV
jgi:hypothetical protein